MLCRVPLFFGSFTQSKLPLKTLALLAYLASMQFKSVSTVLNAIVKK